MEKMLKDDFQLKYSTENEEWFVIKVCDKLTKNHHNLENIVTGAMPENKTDTLCSVKSFREYISHIHPENKYMWYYPVDKINPQHPEIWFTRKNIAKNPLASFMSDVSHKCILSQIYTNHSIRVIGCTVLTQCKFSNSEIISVSDHKSVQSLAIYQKTKQIQSMTRSEDQIDITSTIKEIEVPSKIPVIMP